MYEQMTDVAKKVMQLANKKAEDANHECMGGEHILSGIVEAGGLAVTLLTALGADYDRIMGRLQEVLLPCCEPARQGPFQTPKAKKIIEYAHEAARDRGECTDDIDLLVGLLREGETNGARVFASFGVTLERVLEARGKTSVTIFVPDGVNASDIQEYVDVLPGLVGTPDLLEALDVARQTVLALKSQARLVQLLQRHVK